MALRIVKESAAGYPSVDGAGVQLIRVLGSLTVQDFDPFLMLDAFDSTNPEDYIKGFPRHPHRGIETFTYIMQGEVDHEDSLGNKGKITDNSCQWMTAGSGILHQEMPQASKRLLGLQLWINLPRKDKICLLYTSLGPSDRSQRPAQGCGRRSGPFCRCRLYPVGAYL